MKKLFIVILIAMATASYSNGVKTSFPYREFLGLTKEPLLMIDEVSMLCHAAVKIRSPPGGFGNLFQPPQNKKACSCKSTCMRFRSCCMDYLWNISNPEPVPKYTERFLQEVDKHPKLECQAVANNLPSTFTVEKILMRTECLSSATKDQKYKCRSSTSVTDVQPILGNDGLIYKNKHCAQCNQIQDYKKLDLSASNCIESEKQNAKTFTEKFTSCKIKLSNMSNTVENESIQVCANFFNKAEMPKTVTQDLTSRLCHSYRASITAGPLYKCYDNHHCFKLITGEELDLESDKGSCPFTLPKSRLEIHNIGFGATDTYSQLVSFEDLHQDPSNKCSKGQIYDIVVKQCIDEFSCGFGYEKQGTKCVKKVPVTPNPDFGAGEIGVSQKEILKRCLSPTINAILDKNKMPNGTHIPKYGKLLLNTSKTLSFSFDIKHIDDVKQVYGNYATIIKSTVQHHYLTPFYGPDFKRTFKNNKICAQTAALTTSNYNISLNCWLITKSEKIPNTQYVLNSIFRDRSTDAEIQITICETFHLDSSCPKRIIDNYTHFDNATIKDESTGAQFPPQDYVPIDTGLGVCLPIGPKTASVQGWESVANGVEKYITIVGCFMSIFCYVWVILTYTIIPALKTIPGKNIVCLCTVLLSADITMLITMLRLSNSACATFGAFLHYFTLSVQVWAGIVAYDIWSTFHGHRGVRNVKSNKRFHWYLAVGYLVPLVIVIICVALEMSATVNFGYGLGGVCWIALFTPRLIAYILPMALITLFNVAVLSYTIFCICKQSRKSKKLLKKTGGQDVSIARMSLKLIILIGVIELLGLIQIKGATTEQGRILNTVSRIIYSVVRSFRGVFIWLLYIVTDRVFKVYRDIRSQRSLRTTTRSTYVSRRGTQSRSEAYSTANEQRGLMDPPPAAV
ncbi:uncharacterized protein [Clytia hemisphaerica]|uniref:uncharacterized protein n=1 Tax=Clytia hemisphaerica TaxID=252671 RepID=UPI0034D78F8A